MSKLLVYVSGPYSGGNVDKNIDTARKVCAQLWSEGYAVICPHANTARFEDISTASYEDYIEGDLLMVGKSDAVVMLPGWEGSRGADKEREHARNLSIPVYYWPARPIKPEWVELDWKPAAPPGPRPGLHPAVRLPSGTVVDLPQPFGSGTPVPTVRQFESGATRDTDSGKLDYEAFISPAVLERYGRFMHKNRYQKDGSLRDGDNWQKGIPLEAYRKSLLRHVIEAWSTWRGARPTTDEIEQDTICAIMFNAMGMLHELLKQTKDVVKEVRCE